MRSVNAMNKKLLLLPISLLLLSSCSSEKKYPPIYEYRINSVYKTIREEFFELHKEEIVERYYNNVEARNGIIRDTNNKNWYPSANDLGIEFTWGVYDDTYVVSMYFHRSGTTTAFFNIPMTRFVFNGTTVELTGEGLDGGLFAPQDRNFIWGTIFFVAYNNHNFYGLEEAYDLGLLNDDDINTLCYLSRINFRSLNFFDYFRYDNAVNSLIDRCGGFKQIEKRNPDYDYKQLIYKTYYSSLFSNYLKETRGVDIDVDDILIRSRYGFNSGWILCYDVISENIKCGYDNAAEYTVGNNVIKVDSTHIPMVFCDLKDEGEYYYLPIDEAYNQGLISDYQVKQYDTVMRFYLNGTHGYLRDMKLERYYYDFNN